MGKRVVQGVDHWHEEASTAYINTTTELTHPSPYSPIRIQLKLHHEITVNGHHIKAGKQRRERKLENEDVTRVGLRIKHY